jgi:3-oxoadipate CoA-transferase beta subunit
MMEQTTKGGEAKLVERCSYPLTGLGCVARVYTDFAVIDITPSGLALADAAPGWNLDSMQALNGAQLTRAAPR